MKTVLKTLLGLSLLLCLSTGCEELDFDGVETEQAPDGKDEEDPCRDNCD